MKIKANGIHINYEVDGPDGAPWLILSNSLATNFHMWDPQADALSKSLRVLRYDQRGHGSTDAPAGPYTFELLIADAVALMDALNIKRGWPNIAPGQHVDVGRFTVHQWTQPDRPAGVAREFATSIHGEINPDVGSYLLNEQAGRAGELELMGVDGIVVAREVNLAPRPSTEWELVVSTDEGNVFHRRGAPFSRVRPVTSIDSRPNQQLVPASVANVDDSRNRVQADVDVPNGCRSAYLLFRAHTFADTKHA